MGLKHGFNIGTNDMKKLLEENNRQLSGVRSWKQLFGGASQDYAAQNSALVSSYSDTIAQAYKSSLAQNDAAISAGLNTGATRELIESNRAALHNAYQTYIQNYGKAAEANAQSYMNTVNDYNDELTARAENFSKLYNSAYQYLAEELANSTYNGNTGGPIANGTSWLSANNLDWLYDNDLQAATPWETLSGTLFDTETGEITRPGQAFFDAMFNAQTGDYINNDGKATRGFDQWLSDTNPELRDWYVQNDVYNYTRAGSNLGTAKSLLGLESTDDKYAPHEYAPSEPSLAEKMYTDAVDHKKEYGSAIYHDEISSQIINSLKTKYNNYVSSSPESDPMYYSTKREWLEGYNGMSAHIDSYVGDYEHRIAYADEEMRKALGEEKYQEFLAKNSDVINQMKSEFENARKIENFEDYFIKEKLDKNYTHYLSLYKNFMKGYTQRSKSSGF